MTHPGVPAADGLGKFRLSIDRLALLVIDFQERLAAAMSADECRRCERNICLLVELARRRSIPVIVSEQYPKGLGPTVPAIGTALSAPELAIHRFEKLDFSCVSTPRFQAIFDRVGRDHFIVVGMETHVCVYQTVRGLLERGVTVHVPADAVASRDPAHKQIALSVMSEMGAVVTSTEMSVFDLVGSAGSDDFKALARFLK